MTIGIHSPDTGNYLIGKGFVLLKPVGDTDYYHVGNVPELEITPDVETLEHFSSMEGTKVKDEVIVLTKSGTIRMVMQEITARNIALLMLGDVDEDGYGGATIDLFSRSSIETAFKFYGNNDKGPRWFFDLPRVIWNPSGAFAPISDEYAGMEATGEWASDGGDFGTATLLSPAGTAAPVNVLAPIVTGSLIEGGVLTANNGAWVGASSFTYQWNADGSPISLATSKTYTLTNAEVGSVISVEVTAANTIGSTMVESADTDPVAS